VCAFGFVYVYVYVCVCVFCIDTRTRKVTHTYTYKILLVCICAYLYNIQVRGEFVAGKYDKDASIRIILDELVTYTYAGPTRRVRGWQIRQGRFNCYYSRRSSD